MDRRASRFDRQRRIELERAGELFDAARAAETPLSILLFDLDHFKEINDTLGHHVGDLVLESFAEVVHDCLRAGDLLGRIGGEEFLAVLPGVDALQARSVAERVRREFARRGIRHGESAVPATVSIGVVSLGGHEATLEQLLSQADRALYRKHMQAMLREIPNLEIRAEAVEDLKTKDGIVTGIVTASGAEIFARAVVLTTGTFLNGLIHIGETQIPAGRMRVTEGNEPPSLGLSRTLYGLGLPMGRLKTGTPPRLDGRTINWAMLEAQQGDDPPVPFSFLTRAITTLLAEK